VRSLRRIRNEIALYRDTDLITDDDLHRSVTSNIDYIIGNIVDGGTLDLRAPEQTGRARASTSVPLADVLAAYRLTFSLIWTEVASVATQFRRTEPVRVDPGRLTPLTPGVASDYGPPRG